MTRTSVFLVIACGVALNTACGGSETNNGTTGGDASAAPESDANAGIDAETAPTTDSMPPQQANEAGAISISCMSAQTCGRNQACCASITNSGVTVACASRCSGNQFQLCTATSECPAGEQCTASGFGASYCAAARAVADAGTRVTRDAGAVEDGGSADATPASDAAAVDGGPSDGGTGDGALDDASGNAGDGGDGGAIDSGSD